MVLYLGSMCSWPFRDCTYLTTDTYLGCQEFEEVYGDCGANALCSEVNGLPTCECNYKESSGSCISGEH